MTAEIIDIREAQLRTLWRQFRENLNPTTESGFISTIKAEYIAREILRIESEMRREH